jgi:hypothetical protein
MAERTMQRQEGVSRGDFELVLAVLSKESTLTAREISKRLRTGGNERFTTKVTNQVLYRLLTADLVIRDGTGEKPKWSINRSWFGTESAAPLKIKSMNPRPLRRHNSFDRNFLVSETMVKVIFSDLQSVNDPYLTPDWVGSNIISTINCNHPFWQTRLVSDENRSLFAMVCAVDAYVEWKIVQMNSSVEISEIERLRDQAFRYCSLLEAEKTTPD